MNAITKEQQTALSLPERAAVALGASEHETKLRELVKSSADIVAVIDPAGREQAHRIGMNLKGARVAIEKVGKTAREDATAFSKAIIAEEKRLIAIAEPEEERILSLRDKFDAAEQARKDALIAAERARVGVIQAAIQAIREIPIAMAGKSSQDISRCIASLVGTIPDEFYQEFIEQAQAARHEALDKLAAMETAQLGVEIEAESQRQEAARVAAAAEEARLTEAARIEAERAELAKQRAENERIANEQAAERQRLANLRAAQEAEQRRIAEQAAANLRAEREAQEEAMRRERSKAADEQAERDRVAAGVKAQLEAQAAQIAVDRKAFEDEQAAAAQREEARIAADALRQQVEVDRAEALEMNAEFDAAIARLDAVEVPAFTEPADLARCNGMVADLRADASLAAYVDAGLDDPELTDEEIIEFGREVGLGLAELVARLEAFTVYARAELLVAA